MSLRASSPFERVARSYSRGACARKASERGGEREITPRIFFLRIWRRRRSLARSLLARFARGY